MTADTKKDMIKTCQAMRGKMAHLKDEDAWREFTAATTGEPSLRAMTIAQLDRLRARLRELKPDDRPRLPDAKGHGLPYADNQQLKMLRAIWLRGGREGWIDNNKDAALSEFIFKASGQKLGVLTNSAVDKVKSALRRIETRFRGARPVPTPEDAP
jgi:hypothetical protein